jgi:D-alanyl-lipoteichoic acid acyltransferase DltB (MBOAT superfamily)
MKSEIETVGAQRSRLPAALAQAPAMLIIAAAAAIFANLAAEYLAQSWYFGGRQVAFMVACVGLMLSASAWEVRLGLRKASEAVQFWVIAAFVALLVAALISFNLESRAFARLIGALTLCGFIINHHLPMVARRAFFASLSLVAIACIFGPASWPAAVAIVAIGLVLIGVCHLPAPMWARLGLIALITAGLAATRAEWVRLDWLAAVIPILASVFMFRLAVYLYDISNGKGPKDLWGRLGYFFMFPNMVLPFFPVVDFSAFGRTYYNADAISIYRNGAIYVLRGLIHLLLYRLIYMYAVLAPDQIDNAATFLQYIVANFGLYLKISGLFHLVTGMLVLFGFNLPETHTRFYFANSFIDFWRRINIYWKDFMQKMVFTPSYMQFKKFGASHMVGVSLSILMVFFTTWALHAYQWFWLRGTYLFTLNDMMFWAILGVLLIGQTLLESRPRKAASGSGLIGPRALLVIRTICTFLFICLLWSFWTSASVEDWLAIVKNSGLAPALLGSGNADAAAWLTTLASLVGLAFLVAVAMGITFGLAKPAPAAVRAPLRKGKRPQAFYRPILLGGALAAGLVAIQLSSANLILGREARDFANAIGGGMLNRADQALLTRGYYEDLAGEGVKDSKNNLQLTDLLNQSRTESPTVDFMNNVLSTKSGILARKDYLAFEFEPNAIAHLGSTVGYPINRWGMADKDYTLKKPDGTFRIAMIGASRVQGLGLPQDQRFESLLEERLNAQQTGDRGESFEILNFGMRAYSPVQRLMSFEEKALPFEPDAVIYGAGLVDTWVDYHASMIRRGVSMPYPFLDEINRKAGVDKSMSQAELERRLAPYGQEIVSRVYREIISIAKSRGMQAIWVYIPDTGDRPRDADETERAAKEAGFVTIRLNGFNPRLYQQSLSDSHPNAEGNRILADMIYGKIMEAQARGELDLVPRRGATDHPKPQ